MKYLCWKPAVVCSGNSSRNPVISCLVVHMLSLQQANISTELFESETRDFYLDLPSLKKAGCVWVNLSKQLSGLAWNNMKKNPLPQNFFLLRSPGSLSWHPFGPTSCLSPTVILSKRVTLISPTQKCHLGRTWGFSAFVHDFWLAQHPETMEMFMGKEGCSSLHIQKSDSLGRAWFSFMDFIDDLCFCCVWHAQDV